MELKVYYASLVRGLVGYYVKFLAPNDSVVKEHLALYYGRMWCSVYEGKPYQSPYGRKATVINEENPIVLETSEWE